LIAAVNPETMIAVSYVYIRQPLEGGHQESILVFGFNPGQIATHGPTLSRRILLRHDIGEKVVPVPAPAENVRGRGCSSTAAGKPPNKSWFSPHRPSPAVVARTIDLQKYRSGVAKVYFAIHGLRSAVECLRGTPQLSSLFIPHAECERRDSFECGVVYCGRCQQAIGTRWH
jgi:hypothetical protein